MRPPSEGKFSALWAEVSHRLQCIHTSAAPGRHIKKHACIGSHAKQVANPSLAYLNLFLFDNLALLLKHLFRFTAVTVRRASHGKIADVKRLARKSVCFSETISISHRELFGNKPTSKRITSIQVRIYGPRLGVVKGMLQRKPQARTELQDLGIDFLWFDADLAAMAQAKKDTRAKAN